MEVRKKGEMEIKVGFFRGKCRRATNFWRRKHFLGPSYLSWSSHFPLQNSQGEHQILEGLEIAVGYLLFSLSLSLSFSCALACHSKETKGVIHFAPETTPSSNLTETFTAELEVTNELFLLIQFSSAFSLKIPLNIKIHGTQSLSLFHQNFTFGIARLWQILSVIRTTYYVESVSGKAPFMAVYPCLYDRAVKDSAARWFGVKWSRPFLPLLQWHIVQQPKGLANGIKWLQLVHRFPSSLSIWECTTRRTVGAYHYHLHHRKCIGRLSLRVKEITDDSRVCWASSRSRSSLFRWCCPTFC